MKKIQIIGFSITLLISFACSTLSYGMETAQQKEEKELQTCFEQWLPKELKQQIVSVSFSDAIKFLGLHPITLAGHTYQVNSVAIAGDKLVTGSYDKTAKIWDVNTGQLLYTLVGHNDWVNSVAISGYKVVSTNGTVKIWDINTGQLLHTLARWVNSVAISGDKVATGSYDGTVKIRDINTGQSLCTLQGHMDSVNSVAIDGDKVVTGSSDKTVKIWDINTGQLLHTLYGYGDSANSVAISGDKVATGSYDDPVKIWDINTGQLLHTLGGRYGGVNSIVIAGDKVVAGLGGGAVKIWDINTGQLLRTLKQGRASVCSVAVDGNKVVTGLSDNTAQIWSLSPNLRGTIQNNPLLWIMQETTIPQIDLINRAYKTTIAWKDFIIALPEKLGKVEENELQAQRDGRIYFTFPGFVRQYLRDRLNIKPAQLDESTRWCSIQ